MMSVEVRARANQEAARKAAEANLKPMPLFEEDLKPPYNFPRLKAEDVPGFTVYRRFLLGFSPRLSELGHEFYLRKAEGKTDLYAARINGHGIVLFTKDEDDEG